jgi:hypothetical protein
LYLLNFSSTVSTFYYGFIIFNFEKGVNRLLENYDTYTVSGAGTAQSVQRLAMGWAVRRSNPGGGEIFRTVQTGPRAHLASCTIGTGSFPGVKSGRGLTLTTQPI